jgi:hypothetical protein
MYKYKDLKPSEANTGIKYEFFVVKSIRMKKMISSDDACVADVFV